MVLWIARLALVMGAVCGVVSTSVSAAQSQRAGIYSNLAFIEESGDLVGMEILLVPEGRGDGEYRAVVQLAEGGTPQIVVTSIVVKRDEFSLILKFDQRMPEIKFMCLFKVNELECKTSASKETLKRGKSYWQ